MKNMKKLSILLVVAMLMSLILGGCGSSTETTEETSEETTEEVEETEETEEEAEEEVEAEEEAEAVEEEESIELIVFAAASMTETLTEIAELYAEVAPNVTLTFNFDSSGTLKTQIEEGADCDIFISAAQKQMNQLDITSDANTDGLDFVISETRIDLLENKVALVVPDGNPAGIESYEDLATDKLTLLCLGNDDVPVGQYSLEILEYLGIDVTELESEGKITYGSNVKEVTTQVSEATVDCGIIYATDAYSADLDIVDLATSEMCSQVIYPAAVLNTTSNQEAAQAFLDYLQTDEAMAVFESVGFSPAEEASEEEAAVAAEDAEPVELIVFAAASMTETLTEIAELYAEVAPNVTLTFNFDSSGTLKTQIEEGADCDIFISAAQKQMNQLDITSDANTDGLDFVISETRINLLENKVALVVPDGNPAGIESYEDLATDKLTLLCLGNDDVPVGQYSLEILEYLGIDVTELESEGKVTYGSNVKEVTTQVSEATVDCGIIYATDAYSADLDIVDLATSEMCSQVIYPAAVLNITSNQEAAQAFLDYLQTDEAMAVFESVGFTAAE